jgi:hypothetical protein
MSVGTGVAEKAEARVFCVMLDRSVQMWWQDVCNDAPWYEG